MPSRPRRARCRSTRSPSSGCGGSSTWWPAGPAHLHLWRAVVPVDTTVILDITSTDVLHTWWVPALGGQGAGGAGRRHADVVQGRRGGSLPGPLDGLLRHRLSRDARLGSGGQRARLPGLHRAAANRPGRGPGIVQQTQEEQTTPESAIREEGEDRADDRLAAGGGHPRRPGRPQAVDRCATSADHKAVGLLYIATALSFLSLAAVEFALMRLQLIVPRTR